MTARLRRVLSTDFVRRDLGAAALPWAAARVLVLGSLWLSRHLDDRLVPGKHGGTPSAGLFAYDGHWYRYIAEHGYGVRESLRFFPLYPLLGRWLGTIFLDHTAAALVFLSWMSALVFGALVHRLTLSETGDPRVAMRAAWFAAIFPAALSLVLGYAEPLMMVAAVGMFLALRSRRWLPAIVLGLVAGLTRPVGVLLVVPAAIEAWRGWRETNLRERLARLAAVASSGVGMLVYLAWTGLEKHDFFAPFNVQARHDLRGASIDPFTHIYDAVKDTINGTRFGAPLHLVWLAVLAVLLVVIARRLPASYTGYAAVTLLLAITSSNISSFERYAFSTFPFTIGVALFTTRNDVDRATQAIAAGGLVVYSVLAFFQLYVP